MGVHWGCIGGASGGPSGGHREGTSGALFSDFPENASGPAKLAKKLTGPALASQKGMELP